MLLLWTSLVLITRLSAVPIPWPEDYQRNATYDLDKYVCVADDLMFRGGEIVPSTTPCHQCICRPPNVECELTPCEKKVGCRTLQLSDQCCPQYQCECESNGRIYNNGEKLEAPESPCQVCYCRGGQIVCTLIQCYQRDDCKPQQVPGRCCPKYDHCPPLDNRISNLHVTGWPTMQTANFLPASPSTTLGQRQHPSATSRNENTIFYETSASNRFELLGEPPQGLRSSSHETTVRPNDPPGTFTILGETYVEYSTERIPTSLKHSSNPSTGDAHEEDSSLLVSTTTSTGTGAAHDADSSILEATMTSSVDSTRPPTQTGEGREGDSSLLADTTSTLENLTKPSTGTNEVHTDGRIPSEVITTYQDNSSMDKHKIQEEDSTPVEDVKFLENPSEVKEEVHGEDSTLVGNKSSDESSTVEHNAYEEDSTRVEGTTTFSKYPSIVKEDTLKEDSTQLQGKTTSPEDSINPLTVTDEVRNTESSQSQDTTIYPEHYLNKSSETKRYDSRITSFLHKIGTTEGFGNVRVTLIKFQRKTTLSPLTDFATERTLLPLESQTNALVTEGEPTTTQHSGNEDYTRENHGNVEEENNPESKTGSETTIPFDTIAQESEYSVVGKEVGSSESRTDSTEVQNNLSLETSQDPWSNSITNGEETSVNGNNYLEVSTTESSVETAEPTDGEKVSSTYSTTSREESQGPTDAADLQTTGEGSLDSVAGDSSTEISTVLKTKPELASTMGSLPQGDESGLLVADKNEETWEHHRPTQMVTDEIQYITTVNPMKDHSEGENVFSELAKTDNEPHSQHTDQTMAPPSFTKTGDTLSTRFNKLGETEYTTSQPKGVDLREPNHNTESDTPSSWDTTEQSDASHSEDSSTESVTTHTPTSWNEYDESDESTRYVKLGEVVSQTETHLLETEETTTDAVQSNTPKYIEVLESENESTTSTGEEVNDQQHDSLTEKIESNTSEGVATGSETTVSSEKVQSTLLNNTSLMNENTQSTENQLQSTHTTVLPTVPPYVNLGDHSEKSKEDTILPTEPLDDHKVEMSSKPFEDQSSDNSHAVNEHPSTFNDTHHLPATTLEQDNAPLPIFKLSEEMSNHQMVVEIHHITSATAIEDSAEEAMLNKNDSRDKVVTEEHTNKYPSEVTDKEKNNTHDRNVSITEEKHSLPSNLPVGLNETLMSTLSTSNENGEDSRITTDMSNEKAEHTTAAIDVLENTTDSLEQQEATETVSTEQHVTMKSETTYSVKPDVANQTDFDDRTAESVTGSEVTEVPQGKESTTLENVTSSLTSQDIELERSTENGETNENLNDEQTGEMFESQGGGTTMGNTEPSVTVTEISDNVKPPMTSDNPLIDSPASTTERVMKSPEKNMTNAEIKDTRTDSNSSSEEEKYTLPPETTGSFEGNLVVSTGNQPSESSTVVASNDESNKEITHNILNLNNETNGVKSDPVISETSTEQESTPQVTEKPDNESNTKIAFTESLDETTDSPATTVGNELKPEYNITDITTPTDSLTGMQQDTSSDIEDTLLFQSNKTKVGNNNRAEHESATEIEHHLKFQSNKTKDPGNNDTVNGTTNIDFIHALPTGWLKDEQIVNSNQSEGHDGEPSTTITHEPGETSTVEPSTLHVSGNGENNTPKINTVDDHSPGTLDGSARKSESIFTPDDKQSEESIYTRLQREDAEELGKYDLETLQNFFKNLYIQDDHADVSSNS